MLIPKIASIRDDTLSGRLVDKINNKTKPAGSVGRLETLARQIGLIQQTDRPQIMDPQIVVFAGDHGIVSENVSAYPQSVTWQMVENFLMNGAAVNVFANQNGCALQIVDAGVNFDFGLRENLVDRKVSFGTRSFVRAPAMTLRKCQVAVSYGMALVPKVESNVIGFGGIGVGSSISAAALMHKLTCIPVSECVGAGESASNVVRSRKIVQRAALRHAAVSKPLDVLAAVGGFEIAMMVGAMLKAAELRRVLVIDGFVVASALLVASKLEPHILDYCVFADQSEQECYRRILSILKASPLLDLDICACGGSGAALTMPLLYSAAGLLQDMAKEDATSVVQKDGLVDDVMIKNPRKFSKYLQF